jgi:hypothetical protein
MRWDSALRRHFCLQYLVSLVAIWVIGVGFSLAASYDMERFMLSVGVPLLPASIQLWRERRKQEETAKDSERMKSYLEDLWSQAIKHNLPPEELTAESRQLQDELYDRRRRAPPIPEFLYNRTRQEYERQMREAAATMVKDVLDKLGQPAAP